MRDDAITHRQTQPRSLPFGFRRGKGASGGWLKKRSKKAGLPPGTLVHVGEQKVDRPKITVIDYSDNSFEERIVEKAEDCFPYREKKTVTWINVDGIHDVEVVKKIGEHFGLHPLLQEDILNTGQRPKVEVYDNCVYIVLHELSLDDKSDTIETEQVSLVFGENFVVSFQETEGDDFNATRDRLRTGKGKIRSMGTDFLAYSLLDALVDSYFVILEQYAEIIATLETEILADGGPRTVAFVQGMKRDMILLRRSVWPLRDVLHVLERGDVVLVKKAIRPYFKDVYDHSASAIDTIENFRDMLASILDVHLQNLNVKLNDVMKVVAVFSAVFLPLNLVASIFGMNFSAIPGAGSPYGFLLSVAGMAVLGLVLAAYFRRKKWL